MMIKFKKSSFSFFKPQSLPLIGMDITDSAIKVLEIHAKDKQLEVTGYGIVPLELGAISGRQILDYKSVTNSIKLAIEQAQATSRRTAVALPATAVITRTLNLPRDLTEKELESQIYLEASQHIPYALNEVALDFQRLPPLTEQDTHQAVLLVASRKELTNQLDKLLLDAGLEPVAIDTESFAIERATNLILAKLPPSEQNQRVAIADIGATSSTFSVLNQGQVIYSRDFNFGSEQLTEAIQQAFGLSRAKADEAKKTGKLPTEYRPQVLQTFIESSIQQIERQQQLFYSNSRYQDIDKLILAGGSSATEGLASQLESWLGVPTLIANPFLNMRLSKKVNANLLMQDAPALLVACGLALRVNL